MFEHARKSENGYMWQCVACKDTDWMHVSEHTRECAEWVHVSEKIEHTE